MAIRKRGKGRWQVRVRPFPEVTLPTKEAAETVELDLKLRLKLGNLYREKATKLGDELDGLLERKQSMGGKRGPLRPAGVRYYQDCVRPWEPLRDTPVPALRHRQVEDHIAARAAVTPTAARNELQFLKAALRAAQSRGQQVDVGIFEIDPVRVEAREGQALEYEELLGSAPGCPSASSGSSLSAAPPAFASVRPSPSPTTASTSMPERSSSRAGSTRAADPSRSRSRASRSSSSASSSSCDHLERASSSRQRRAACTATPASSRSGYLQSSPPGSPTKRSATAAERSPLRTSGSTGSAIRRSR
jgi:hypothetical protein